MRGGEIFVPKIPSMNVVDLAEVIAPGCKHELVGIRPGEKLHETMISVDDSRNTIEFERHYVIKPAFLNWESGPGWSDGKPVPDRFHYSSDTNPWRLTRDELKKMVEA
jgi:UDP-N-acetylglucosamine 4,6-dehydratase